MEPIRAAEGLGAEATRGQPWSPSQRRKEPTNEITPIIPPSSSCNAPEQKCEDLQDKGEKENCGKVAMLCIRYERLSNPNFYLPHTKKKQTPRTSYPVLQQGPTLFEEFQKKQEQLARKRCTSQPSLSGAPGYTKLEKTASQISIDIDQRSIPGKLKIGEVKQFLNMPKNHSNKPVKRKDSSSSSFSSEDGAKYQNDFVEHTSALSQSKFPIKALPAVVSHPNISVTSDLGTKSSSSSESSIDKPDGLPAVEVPKEGTKKGVSDKLKNFGNKLLKRRDSLTSSSSSEDEGTVSKASWGDEAALSTGDVNSTENPSRTHLDCVDTQLKIKNVGSQNLTPSLSKSSLENFSGQTIHQKVSNKDKKTTIAGKLKSLGQKIFKKNGSSSSSSSDEDDQTTMKVRPGSSQDVQPWSSPNGKKKKHGGLRSKLKKLNGRNKHSKEQVVPLGLDVQEAAGVKRLPDNEEEASGILMKEFEKNAAVQTFSSKADATSTLNSDDFSIAVTNAHNMYRSMHGVPDLVLSHELSKKAQEWADTLIRENKLSRQPQSDSEPLGENIYRVKTNRQKYDLSASQAVETWYRENVKYDWSMEPDGSNLDAGHFTQIIWRNTKELGVGKAQRSDEVGTTIVVVANYSPAGNYLGKFRENVPPKLTSRSHPLKSVPGTSHSRPSSSSSSSSSSGDENSATRAAAGAHAGSSESDIGVRDEGTSRAVALTDGDFSFAKHLLKHHNEYRKLHGVPKLKLSKQLTRVAKDWVTKLGAEGAMRHRADGKYGENIFMKWSSNPKDGIEAREVADQWYQEIEQYKSWDVEPRSFDMNSGHFTQMVWAGTRYMGAAVAKTKDGKHIVVANYYPPGNFMGTFTKNVHAPLQIKK